MRKLKQGEVICLCQVSDSGEGNGTPLQYSCLENPMDGGAWWAAVHGVAKNWIRLSDFTFTFHFHALEKGMATHSSVLAWRIPGTGEPGGLPSMGSHSRTRLKRFSSSSSKWQTRYLSLQPGFLPIQLMTIYHTGLKAQILNPGCLNNNLDSNTY